MMRLKDISINNLRRRKGKVFFLILGLTIGITTVVTLISITRMMNDDISRKLDEFGANILIIPRSDDLSLSYGGMNIAGVSIDAQMLKDSDVPKIRQIEVRENISTVSPKLIGVVEIEGKRVPLMGVHFEEELRLKKWWKIHGELQRVLRKFSSVMKSQYGYSRARAIRWWSMGNRSGFQAFLMRQVPRTTFSSSVI